MKRRQSGIALLEVLLAVLILAIGLLGTIGLQARAYSALSEADMRAEATIATERLIGIMSNDQGADQSNLAAYALAAGGAPGTPLKSWYNATVAQIPGASITVVITPSGTRLARVDITIGWVRRKGDPLNQHRLTSYIAAS
jgi:type IV pilus assembly protein PilV